MNKVKSIWLQLAPNAALCCQEPVRSADTGDEPISIDLLSAIAAFQAQHSWNCTILANEDGIPPVYQKLCDRMNAEFVVPAGPRAVVPGKRTAISFESSCADPAAEYPGASRAILRIRRDCLSRLAEIILALSDNFPDVSIRHPELLDYEDADIATYGDQLSEVGRRLLDKGQSWKGYRIDRLTDRFRLEVPNECGAGVTKLAVASTGRLYTCPAAMVGSEPPCGHVLDHLELPNRHLLTRRYSVPCGKCGALHCSRCIYLNKRATLEFCVPPRNVCRLAHVELEVQAWFAQEAIRRNLWNESYNVPEPPVVYDPFEILYTERTRSVTHSWRRLVRFSGRPDNLQPAAMLDIIHGLNGWCRALEMCARAGCAPSAEMLERDVLASLRRRTIEQYRDTVFNDGSPTVRQIELLMCDAFRSQIEQP